MIGVAWNIRPDIEDAAGTIRQKGKMFPKPLTRNGGGDGAHNRFDIRGGIGFGIKGFQLARSAVTENKDHTMAGFCGFALGTKSACPGQHSRCGHLQKPAARTCGPDSKHGTTPVNKLGKGWENGKKEGFVILPWKTEEGKGDQSISVYCLGYSHHDAMQ